MNLPITPNSLTVSCQPVVGGVFDSPDCVVAFAQAAITGGAQGLRIEGTANVAAARRVLDVPIIGLLKRHLPDYPVYITPLADDVRQLAAAGADIVAFDATARERPLDVETLCELIHSHGKLALADVSCLSEGHAALLAGADYLATTLSGYTGSGPAPQRPDFSLLQALVELDAPVVAEGRIKRPGDAARAMALGAHSVVVGSAITRPEWITERFAKAIAEQAL